MFEDHAALDEAFGAGGADVVGVDHLEHRRAHETAVARDADDRQRQDRKHEVLRAVEDELEPVPGVDRVQPGHVEDPDVPLQIDVDEDDLEDQPEPEGRDRQA